MTQPSSASSLSVEDLTRLFSGNFVSEPQAVPMNRRYKASPLMQMSLEESQEARRRRALEEQQRRRRDFTDHARRLVLYQAIKLSDEEQDEEGDQDVVEAKTEPSPGEASSSMEGVVVERKSLRSRRARPHKKTKNNKLYGNQIMYAEWMLEIPADLQENWYVVLCPVGKRCLLTTAKGKTTCRHRHGFVMNVFESILPAGSLSYRGNKTTDYCILDCIFDQTTSTFYVLDLMCWKGHPIYDCDTEFRFYWLQAKLSELEYSTNTSKYSFKPLTVFTCLPEHVAMLMQNSRQFGYDPDGLLFYNRKTQYVLGDTPLCGWVGMEKAYEIFGPLLGISPNIPTELPNEEMNVE
ncbi:2646_t:CDS:2 [Paraglomus occultum]|uniref:Snurportin-1 n=1 Tax=Paraglomus occultum TaxID=144539 RepID=A0A9N9FMW1_9GLOM|nr:2646_t:CDS:2 [Paraglomus occultum]